MHTDQHDRSKAVAGLGLVGLLLAVSAGLVFQGGSYGPSTWLPIMVAVAALGLVVAVAGPAVSSGRIPKIILAMFALQTIWTAASFFWAESQANAWEEANRTVFYLTALLLTFVAVRWAGTAALKAIASSVIAIAVAVAAAILVTLGVSSDPSSLFLSGRLYYPITYFNGLAALLMVGFWLALGMANGARCTPKPAADGPDTDDKGEGEGEGDAPSLVETPPASEVTSRVAWRRSLGGRAVLGSFPRWTQPVLLILAVVLAETALLPQSRGALWTFFLAIPFFLIFSPHRFRALINVIMVAVPVVLFWGKLNAPYMAIADQTPLGDALTTYLIAVGYSAAIVLGIWALTWLVERLIGPLRRKAAVWVGVALATLAIFGAAAGIVYADVRADDGLDGYLSDRWQELTDDSVGNTQGATRFSGVGLNGRWRTWQVALQAFEDNPALGLGAQNFEDYFYQHRTFAYTLKQPHSLPLRLLAELGVPGALLWVAFVLAALVYAASVRFRSSDWSTRVVVAAGMTAVISWFVHSSADWLWQMAGVSMPAIMLFGAILGADKGSDPLSESEAPRRSWSRILIRTLLALLALGAIASAAFPYLSSRYSAMAAGAPDLVQAQARADTAAWLDPTSVEPYAALATAHRAQAATAPNATARLEELRLAATAWQEAIKVEPMNWGYHYQAAEALLAARDSARDASIFSVTQELVAQARIHLQEARRLNPLSPEVAALEATL